ncbi:MAG: [CysO sulfur-carrier protein]-S-L-cysteine hydrolase [Acidobacteriota bacterium]|jgi:proteasome lid subunit RPN8/RPN11|nr:[CysO sulfur-carrier protein]-S-L-cysteine hydrolase [Acidobacteriota bacterium]
MITLLREHVDGMLAHAREASPAECCGLIGGSNEESARSVYRLRNVASDPLVGYEAAPEELFGAQRLMRERGEQLLGIYHSHPRASEPVPSETDVRLAYYPSAIYFIIGLAATKETLRAFRISERDGRWERIEYAIIETMNDER